MWLKPSLALAASWLFAGCAVHPQTQDVTALDTKAVVLHIRCEARGAVLRAIGDYLSWSKDSGSLEVSREILVPDTAFELADLRRVDPRSRQNIEKYLPSAIAYDFTFDITEDNDVGTQVDVLDTFTRGTLGLVLKAEAEGQRQSIRNFRITDVFSGLLAPKYHQYCRGTPPGENLAYPIVGRVGLDEMVKTFVDLNEFQDLGPAKDSKDKAPVLADQFNFTTTIMGSAAPKVTLSPLGRGVRLMDASFAATGSRKDVHKLIVAISLPPAVPSRVQTAAAAQLVGPAFRLTTLAFDKTPAEQNAIAEIYNQLERNILGGVVVRAN